MNKMKILIKTRKRMKSKMMIFILTLMSQNTRLRKKNSMEETRKREKLMLSDQLIQPKSMRIRNYKKK